MARSAPSARWKSVYAPHLAIRNSTRSPAFLPSRLQGVCSHCTIGNIEQMLPVGGPIKLRWIRANQDRPIQIGDDLRRIRAWRKAERFEISMSTLYWMKEIVSPNFSTGEAPIFRRQVIEALRWCWCATRLIAFREPAALGMDLVFGEVPFRPKQVMPLESIIPGFAPPKAGHPEPCSMKVWLTPSHGVGCVAHDGGMVADFCNSSWMARQFGSRSSAPQFTFPFNFFSYGERHMERDMSTPPAEEFKPIPIRRNAGMLAGWPSLRACWWTFNC